MAFFSKRFIVLMALTTLSINTLYSAPPYRGTVWFSPDIITDADPSAFIDITYRGQENRQMFDRRLGRTTTYYAYRFDARFAQSLTLEILVNPEFSQPQATSEARKYARYLGKIPAFLFRDMKEVYIHRGNEGFGGGRGGDMTIHTDMGQTYLQDGVLEETMMHEAAHISFDRYHDNNNNWRQAQNRDGVSISDYGQEFPVREDLAETLGPYLALRFRRARIGESLAQVVLGTIPNRVSYLDGLNLSMAILGGDDSGTGTFRPKPGSRLSPVTTFRWSRPDNATDFDLIIGTNGKGSGNIRGSSVFNQTSLEVRNLPTNVPVYVQLWVWNGKWSYTDYMYNTDTGNTCSVNAGDVICPAPGSTLNSTTTFFWARKPNVTDFDLMIGTNGAGSNNISSSSVFNSTYYTAHNLPSNRRVYLRLWEWNGAWSYTDYIYNTD